MQDHKQNQVLGLKVTYPEHYNPDVLVRIPRSENRENIPYSGIDVKIYGADIWNAWEAGFLLDSGVPRVGVLKMSIPLNSEFMVESKSLKLYLNSFNMDRMGKSINEAVAKFTTTIKTDLSRLLECKVDLSFFQGEDTVAEDEFREFRLLENLVDTERLEVKDYTENPELLTGKYTTQPLRIKRSSELLRSRCKVTSQPDWGSVFIDITSNYEIDDDALLKYLISFRNENHFHEEICETIFSRLYHRFNPQELMVACVYTRRGGIDISPLRSTSKELLPPKLMSL